MQQRPHALRTAALTSPLVLFALLSFVFGEIRSFDSSKQADPRASGREITISLKMADSREITVSQYDGEMIRTGPKGGDMLGITPRLRDDGSITLEFFRVVKIIRKHLIVGEDITSMGSMEVNTTLAQSAPVELVSSVQLLGISRPPEESGVRVEDVGADGCPCCITCDGYETCGMSVQASCGQCKCY